MHEENRNSRCHYESSEEALKDLKKIQRTCLILSTLLWVSSMSVLWWVHLELVTIQLLSDRGSSFFIISVGILLGLLHIVKIGIIREKPIGSSAHSRKNIESLFLFSLIDLLKMVLPHKVRKKIYEPYAEEIKEDLLTAPSQGWKWQFVRAAFYFRLFVALAQSLYCWLIGLAFPFLGKLLGLGGSGEKED